MDVITPNADMPNSMALLSMRPEPVVKQAPQITVRYYVPQFEDLFDANPYKIG